VDIKLFLALLAGKIVQRTLTLKGSGATAAPGLVALKIDPGLIKKLSVKNSIKSIVVSGTNGKTTTTRLISGILENKYKIIHNRQGSNLLRGIASTLVKNSSLSAKISCDLALWEADEAALLPISKELNINTLLLLNLFRDQLDRYGEIDKTRKQWQEVIKKLPPSSTLILNSDDPSLNYLSKFSKTKKIFFGIETNNIQQPQIENVQDVKYCINCGHKLKYAVTYSSHMGKYSCPNCTFRRNAPDIYATGIKFNYDFTTQIALAIGNERLTINYPLPGLYNTYNVLAAVAVANDIGTPKNHIIGQINSFSSAFGRYQKVKIGKAQASIFLIKNPAGANEVLRTISTHPNLSIMAILNDNIADGRDVSWIWDTNWEILKDKIAEITVSGNRALDLALRLKYAGIPQEKILTDSNIKTALSSAASRGKPLIILPTYTAMLEIQARLGGKGQKWHEE